MGDGMEEGRLVMALIRAGVLLRLELDRMMDDDLGLTSVELEVLRIIATEGAMSAAPLAWRLGVKRQSLQPLLERLARDELLDAERSTQDRRVIDYSLTRAGHSLGALGNSALLELERKFLSTFPRRPEGLALLVEQGVRAAVQEEIRTVFYAMR